ncbi:FecR family protein [Spirochaeta isovalerica]|uniref:FecR protein domain-containing protein n=1 Tax=Spirochaeta isovalerica TaxID=150 RepID=A0A841RAN0_9SPIO|nr:FecR domain-containing protein [Spirochaeta isovalerica]MBB6479738.1 hypothetical protein [Spirochaeta isovalerica]
MKKTIFALILIFALSLCLAAQEVTVREVSGRVEIQLAGQSWKTLSKGDVVPVAATISTGFQSRAVLLSPRATIVVQPLTRLTIDQLQDEGASNQTSLSLRTGRITAAVKKNETEPTRFQVRSPIATAAVRGTEFTFNGFQLQVTDGLVAFSSDGGRIVTVPVGASSEMQDGGIPQEVVDAIVEAVSVDPSAAIDTIIPLLDNLGFIDFSIDDLIVTIQ